MSAAVIPRVASRMPGVWGQIGPWAVASISEPGLDTNCERWNRSAVAYVIPRKARTSWRVTMPRKFPAGADTVGPTVEFPVCAVMSRTVHPCLVAVCSVEK